MPEIPAQIQQWLFSGDRWPLWLPIAAVSVTVSVLKGVYKLELRESLGHWATGLTLGVSLIAAGILYWTVRPGELGHVLAGPIILVVGVIVALRAGGQFWPQRPARLPADRIVVGVARFKAVADNASNEAANFAHRLARELRARKDRGAPLEVRELRGIVGGRDEQERERSARALGASKWRGAHLVVWGEVRLDDAELYVRLGITAANRVGRVNLASASLPTSDYQSLEPPKHLEFKCWLASKTADLPLLVYGAALVHHGEWNRAIQVLEQLGLPEARLYHGIAVAARAEHSADLRSGLSSAVAILEQIENTPIRAGKPQSDLAVLATLNWSNAKLMLAQYELAHRALEMVRDVKLVAERMIEAASDGAPGLLAHTRVMLARALALEVIDSSDSVENDRPQYERATAAFQSAAEDFRQEDELSWQARSLLSLGKLHENWSHRLPYLERRAALEESISSTQAAAPLFLMIEEYRGWCTTQLNLGAALRSLAGLLIGDERTAVLRRAITVYESALRLTKREQQPQQWADLQSNLGNALRMTALVESDKQRCALLEQAIAAHRAALEIATLEKAPRSYAQSQSNLGNALSDSANLGCADVPMTRLQEALEAQRRSAAVFEESGPSVDLAMSRVNEGQTLLFLATRDRSAKWIPDLRESVAAIEDALTVYAPDEFLAERSRAHGVRGNLLGFLSGLVDDRGEVRVFLREAARSFELARDGFTSLCDDAAAAESEEQRTRALLHLQRLGSY